MINRFFSTIKPESARRTALTVSLIVFAVFFIYPLFFVVVNSFRPNADIILKPTGLPVKMFIGNYVQAWHEMQFPKVFLNTLLVTVLGTGGIIISSATSAPYKFAISFLIALTLLFASSEVAVFPVPIAQIGS